VLAVREDRESLVDNGTLGGAPGSGNSSGTDLCRRDSAEGDFLRSPYEGQRTSDRPGHGWSAIATGQ